MPKINRVTLDHTIEWSPPPAPQAVFSIDASSYQVNEEANLIVAINRATVTDEEMTVDWAFVNASVLPVSGTLTFPVGSSQETIQVTAEAILSTEEGTFEISNPLNVDPGEQPLIGSPSSVPVTVTDIGAVIYGDVVLVPPSFTSDPVIITSVDTLENGNNVLDGQPIKKFRTGISNSPDTFQYVLEGDGTRDLVLAFMGDTAGPIARVVRIDNFYNAECLGHNMVLPIENQKYSYPTEQYPYPKIPGGMCYRISVVRKFWWEGGIIDCANNAVALNGDYFVFRGEHMNPASPYDDYFNSGHYFQNYLFKGMEGAGAHGVYGDTMYHADYWHTQSVDDPVGRPYILAYDNGVKRDGHEGIVWHGHSQGTGGTRPFFYNRNCDSNINQENTTGFDYDDRSPGHGIHAAIEAPFYAAIVGSNITLINVKYSRVGDYVPYAKIDDDYFLCDPDDAGGVMKAHAGLERYAQAIGTIHTEFVDRNGVGMGVDYVSPWPHTELD